MIMLSSAISKWGLEVLQLLYYGPADSLILKVKLL